MTENGKKYAEISEEKRKEAEDAIYYAVVEQFRREPIEGGFYKYEVILQDFKFNTIMTDEELQESAKLTVDVLEELKEINNNGMDKTSWERLVEAVNAEEESHVLQVMEIWNRIVTDKLCELLSEIDTVRRVGGTWAMLVANPGLISAIYAVFDRMVDCFNDEELYMTCGFFLLRAVMRMNSDAQ